MLEERTRSFREKTHPTSAESHRQQTLRLAELLSPESRYTSQIEAVMSEGGREFRDSDAIQLEHRVELTIIELQKDKSVRGFPGATRRAR